MRIAIFSDCHCGYAWGEERGDDAFNGLTEALEKSKGSDIILIAGDLFDSRIPKPEIFARVARALSAAQNQHSDAKLIDAKLKEGRELPTLRGIPIVAIHGTHERRSKHLINPIQALEHTGHLLHLHCETAVFDIAGKKVAVHGMSGVPERYAKECLVGWHPRPVHGAINILMLHQSIEPYIYSPLEPPSLKLEDLPSGFDLYVLGHMHWSDSRRFQGTNLLVAGSTCTTSIHKIETEQPKSVWFFDGNVVERASLNSRKVIWKEFTFDSDIRQKIEAELAKLPVMQPKPIVAIKIKGTLAVNDVPPNFADIEERFADKAIININKALQVEGFADQIELLAALKQSKMSPEELGMALLAENLKATNCGIKAEEIFDLLVEGRTDTIFNALMGIKQ
ncbi:MAG: DNA repair exonuclease [Candidatus Aenigmatarchaeota archaeon]|nr:DNA repair exonuclease [Candidatus Aenigmarchaeota archaeon]